MSSKIEEQICNDSHERELSKRTSDACSNALSGMIKEERSEKQSSVVQEQGTEVGACA